MQKSMTQTFASTFAILLGVGACSGEGVEGVLSKAFPTVGLERKVVTDIEHSPSLVCPYYEPAGRTLYYRWWDPVILQEPAGDTLEGLVTISFPPDHHEGTHPMPVYLFVTRHDPATWHIQYQVLWDDIELQRIDITCVRNETGGTRVTWLERNAGFHEDGVPAVTNFVENGGIEHVVETYALRVVEDIKGIRKQPIHELSTRP